MSVDEGAFDDLGKFFQGPCDSGPPSRMSQKEYSVEFKAFAESLCDGHPTVADFEAVVAASSLEPQQKKMLTTYPILYYYNNQLHVNFLKLFVRHAVGDSVMADLMRKTKESVNIPPQNTANKSPALDKSLSDYSDGEELNFANEDKFNRFWERETRKAEAQKLNNTGLSAPPRIPPASKIPQHSKAASPL